jgi:hypothetical protein
VRFHKADIPEHIKLAAVEKMNESMDKSQIEKVTITGMF